MVNRVDETIVFITEPPRVEIGGGVVRVTDRSGAQRIERAMPIRMFSIYAERYQRALRQHAADDQYIVVDD